MGRPDPRPGSPSAGSAPVDSRMACTISALRSRDRVLTPKCSAIAASSPRGFCSKAERSSAVDSTPIRGGHLTCRKHRSAQTGELLWGMRKCSSREDQRERFAAPNSRTGLRSTLSQERCPPAEHSYCTAPRDRFETSGQTPPPKRTTRSHRPRSGRAAGGPSTPEPLAGRHGVVPCIPTRPGGQTSNRRFRSSWPGTTGAPATPGSEYTPPGPSDRLSTNR